MSKYVAFATFCSDNLSLYQDCESYLAEEESEKWKYIFPVKGQLHIAGSAMDIGHGSIYGNWQGMRVGHVKDLRIYHGSATDLLWTATSAVTS